MCERRTERLESRLKLSRMAIIPQIGDIVIVKSNTIIGRIIRWITNSWASHVAVYIGNGYVFEARPGGATAVHISAYEGDKWEYRVFRLLVSEETKEKFIARLIQKEARGYDYGQIISIALHRLFGWELKAQNRRLAICSEIIYEAAFEAGIPVPSTPRAYIVPGDFLNWRLLAEVLR